ncbi:tetratricopeptide repeat protein 31 isoform X1 [Lepisosteus oculatus]|uniref:Tetratricopeptide repeat protein 31 n=2 Tax=Lepisosteus oculatus TaxID=7918 RepID=W5M1B6_LEPOC
MLIAEMSRRGKVSEGYRTPNYADEEAVDFRSKLVMDLWHEQHRDLPYILNQRVLRQPMYGLDFERYDDDDYDNSDDDSDDYYNPADYSQTPYCGFKKHFLTTASSFDNHTNYRYLGGFSTEEAEKNAKELIEEEERVKQKAEKKKLKRMRQKERKRKEKIENKNKKANSQKEASSKKLNSTVSEEENKSNKDISPEKEYASTPSDQKKNKGVISTENSEEDESQEDSSKSESEDELDMNSCFVTKAASIAQRKMDKKPKPEKKEKKKCSPNRSDRKSEVELNTQQKNGAENSDKDIIMKSMELAVIGNQLANSGRFEVAVKYFTDAIKYNPKEFRIFGNRSFCYEKMQEYDKALSDAEISLSMNPKWTKGLYRKGRALAGLKRYIEAAQAFKEVLKLDSSCTDAAQELMRVQITQLMDMGFTREQSSNALIIHGTFEKALDALSSIHDVKVYDTQPDAGSSPAAEEDWIVPKAKKPHAAAKPVLQTHPQPKPSLPQKSLKGPEQQPLELVAVWVGNVTPSVTEKMLQQLFSSAGEIHSMRVLYGKRCAFINYTKKESAERAILAMQGKDIDGSKLIVRYPDHVYKHIALAKTSKASSDQPAKPANQQKANGECVYWRTGGCTKREKCIFKHIPEHKGIDGPKKSSAAS